MRQGGEPQGVQVVRQGEPTPYHCNFNRLYFVVFIKVGRALAAHAVSGCLGTRGQQVPVLQNGCCVY
nr:hypothetical protein [uncultured Kingella sp.]